MTVTSIFPRLLFGHCINCVLYKQNQFGIKKLWAATKQRSSNLAVRRAANTPYHKNIKCYEMEQTDRQTETWTA